MSNIKPNENLVLLRNFFFSASSIWRLLKFASPCTVWVLGFFLRTRGVEVNHPDSGTYGNWRKEKTNKKTQNKPTKTSRSSLTIVSLAN